MEETHITHGSGAPREYIPKESEEIEIPAEKVSAPEPIKQNDNPFIGQPRYPHFGPHNIPADTSEEKE